ncbi:MAG: redoxin domain-containing protein [Planctomycetota bacterium]|jgi:thiol-disulfide isomerase/thioredoxin
MKLRDLLVITLLCAGLLAGCSKKEEPAPQAPSSDASRLISATLRKEAASLDGLTYLKGDAVTFKAGKVTVIEFWATWCPPCKDSIPHLTDVQRQFKDKGVTVIGISDETTETVKPFVEKMGDKMGYTVALDTEGKANDGYMTAYKQGGIPTAFVVDGKGRVAWVGHPMNGLEGALNGAIAEAGGETIAEAMPAVEVEAPAAPAPEPKVESAQLGQKAGPLEGLTYVKGDAVSFEAGKTYVVEFWATWCGPCRTSIPHLTEVQNQFKEKGVTVIGISSEDAETVKPFVEKMGGKMEYTVALDTDRKVNDAYMKTFNQRGIPTAFIVDGKGNVAWVGHPMGGLEEVLELVVAGSFDPQAYAKAEAERQAAERELHKLYQDYNAALIQGAAIEETRPTAEKIIESNNPRVMNALAWHILKMPSVDEANRDTEIALKAADKANTETKGEDPMVLDTYALALFQNDRVAEAVATQQKAIDLAAGNERIQADMKTRLEEFKAALESAK